VAKGCQKDAWMNSSSARYCCAALDQLLMVKDPGCGAGQLPFAQ